MSEPRSRTLMGIEHELGVLITPDEALERYASPAVAVLRFGGFAELSTPCGQYLENGARLYVDCGEHPEYATPECASAEELVAADWAGVELLAGIATRAELALAESSGLDVRVRLLRNNASPNGESWGTHENYLVAAGLSWADLAQPLASHLASRICFSGAGTIMAAPGQRSGRYRLSSRAAYVGCVLASSAVSSPPAKPMILSREEPLADPRRFRRVQVVSGDANMAQTASLLKLGTTAIALRLIEAGTDPRLLLDDPVAALHHFNDDDTLTTTVSAGRRRLRAIDVQWIWLEAAARHHEQQGLPREEVAILKRWEDTLRDLERDPDLTADRLDWTAKRRVLRALAEGRRLAATDPALVAADLSYHDVRPDRSLYGRLVAKGRMQTVVTPGAVGRLCNRPPASTRAALRGELVRLLRRSGVRHEVSWARWRVLEHDLAMEIDLTNPFASTSAQARQAIADLTRYMAARPARQTASFPGPRAAVPYDEGDASESWWLPAAG